MLNQYAQTLGSMLVPTEITPEVRLLISRLNITEKPIHISCVPEIGAPQNECFPIVEEKVRIEGGKQILGWQIWQTSLLVEAEFHAVWEMPSGEYLDITPKLLPLSEILFLPDSDAKYEDKQVNNIRINITGNPLVDEFIAIHDAVFRIENRGKRALQLEVSIKGREAKAHKMLSASKAMLEHMALQGDTRNSLCLCESGRKYKVCHGKKIGKLINQYNRGG